MTAVSQPALFVPHGAPTFALRPGAAGAALARLAGTLPRPRAIVIVSAHWDTAVPTVGFADRPETIHDFRGFPDELYALRYPATGCREAAEEVVAAIRAAGLPVESDAERGLDHGAWMPLRLMFPDADVPVIPLSIQSRAGPEAGLAARPGAGAAGERGFLVIASGNITHNLRDYFSWRHATAARRRPTCANSPTGWPTASPLATSPPCSTTAARRRAPCRRIRPTSTCCRCTWRSAPAATTAQAERFHAGIDDYVLAMDAYAFSTRYGAIDRDRALHPHGQGPALADGHPAASGLLALGFYMHDLPLSPQKLQLYSWHKWAGVTAFLLVLVRLAWRVDASAAGAAGRHVRAVQLAAHAGHACSTC